PLVDAVERDPCLMEVLGRGQAAHTGPDDADRQRAAGSKALHRDCSFRRMFVRHGGSTLRSRVGPPVAKSPDKKLPSRCQAQPCPVSSPPQAARAAATASAMGGARILRRGMCPGVYPRAEKAKPTKGAEDAEPGGRPKRICLQVAITAPSVGLPDIQPGGLPPGTGPIV